MNKNTLYITFDGLSDPLGQSQIIPYLTGIASNGFNITILSCEKQDRLDKEKERIKGLFSGYKIQWNYIIYDEDGNFLSRFDYVKQIKELALAEHKNKNFSLVHCRSYLSALVGLNLKQKFGIKFLFDMRGLWADERIDGNIWRKSNILHRMFYNYFKRKEKQFFKEADAVISLTQNGLNYLDKTFFDFSLKSKTTVIPCCVNTELFNPASVEEIETKHLFKESDHVIVYAGSIGTWYYTKEMIECILTWKSVIPTIKLLIVTRDIKELNSILTQFSDEEKQTISFTSLSYQQMPSMLAKAKASIFFIKPAFSKIASSPTKMAECWAMNLPIVTNSGIGDNDIYFNQHKGGILINAFTKADYLKAGQDYLESLKNTANYRQLALNHFDTKLAVKNYTSVYNKLIGVSA